MQIFPTGIFESIIIIDCCRLSVVGSLSVIFSTFYCLATRTSRKAEKFKPYSIIKQKKGKSPASKSVTAKAALAAATSSNPGAVIAEESGTITIIQAEDDVELEGEDQLEISPEAMSLLMQGEQLQSRPKHITFKEIKKK